MALEAPTAPRRMIPMTSLIDVIFLLLLFFMLTSTFSRFAEVPLTSAASGGSAASDQPVLFLQLSPDVALLNGQPVDLDNLVSVLGGQDGPQSMLVSLKGDVTAQRLTDLLVFMAAIPEVSATVLQ